jgi:uncharacterized Zn finger protein
MTIGTKSQYQACIDRAQRQGGIARVTELGAGAYTVLGSRGDVYRVRVHADGNYFCTCPAGTHEVPCWHAAAAWLLRVAQSAAGIAPATGTPYVVARTPLDDDRESDAAIRARLLAESRARTHHISELEVPLADCFTSAA